MEKDLNALKIKNFTYNGKAPDMYFLIGKSGRPLRKNGDAILSYPTSQKTFDVNDENAQMQDRAFKGEDIILRVPKDTKIFEYEWFSIYCRKFDRNFGSVYFPWKEWKGLPFFN